MAQRVKFPVFQALKFTYRWTLTVLRKHWIVALIYAVGTLAWAVAGAAVGRGGALVGSVAKLCVGAGCCVAASGSGVAIALCAGAPKCS